MNTLQSWLAAPEWIPVAKTLLHSLWQAAVVALALAGVFRQINRPALRHALACGALVVLLLSSLLTWALLAQPSAAASGSSPLALPLGANVPADTAQAAAAEVTPSLAQATDGTSTWRKAAAAQATGVPWSGWLAASWLCGAALMLARAGVQVARAEKLVRAGRPPEDPRFDQLLSEARRALGIARRIQVRVTNTLTSPAVVGIFVPTVILPASLLTALSPEQLRFILLHELAHIRRADYLANLLQLFMEAIFFFNPAVWWISHQVRGEREACCDAVATDLSGAPLEYARTLVQVAEAALDAPVLPAPAFPGDGAPSSLADRVQRLLVPGYRPTLRLTWRVLFLALLVGGTLLFLTAVGTRLTIAAILSPEERMKRIEQKMTEYGVPHPSDIGPEVDGPNAPTALVTGRVRTADGSPLPPIPWIHFYHQRRGTSGASSARLEPDGTFASQVRLGRSCVGLIVPGYAPVTSPWVEVKSTNPIENVELELSPGFEAAIELHDLESGQPIADAIVTSQFWVPGMGMSLGQSWKLQTDPAGMAILRHCSDSITVRLTVNAPGYQIHEQEFPQVKPGEPLRLRPGRGRAITGIVLSHENDTPLAGATVRVLYEKGIETKRSQWTDETRILARTDAAGRYRASQLRPGTHYWLGVSAPGHASSIVELGTAPAAGEVTTTLGPELIVQGRVYGDLDRLQLMDQSRCLSRNYSEVFDQTSFGFQEWVKLRVTNGVGYFQFTNHTAGPVTLSAGNFRERREITAPVAGWILDWQATQAGDATRLPKREVIFRFHPFGLSPRGTVTVLVPDSLDPKEPTAHWAELGITNGQVRAAIAVGGVTRLEPKRTVGFWFEAPDYFKVTNGNGPIVVDVPCVPAGAIFATIQKSGVRSPTAVSFGLRELSPAPGRHPSRLSVTSSDALGGAEPGKWASGPVPLGGTYQVHAWTENAFCVSQPIHLTEERPDAEVELAFPPGRDFGGVLLDPNGMPQSAALLEVSFTLHGNHSFGLKAVATDRQGRFRLEGVTPETGHYFVETKLPAMMAERTQLDFRSAAPQTIRLRRGHTLAGRVIASDTGQPIPGMTLRAHEVETYKLPAMSTVTDSDGRFVFSSLGNATYQFYPEGGQLTGDRRFRADGQTNLSLAVKLYEWSKLKAKP